MEEAVEQLEEETGEVSDELPRLDPWQEEVYGLFELFHSTRNMGPSSPDAFSISDLEFVIRLRGYHASEHIINLLVSMDVTYRIWWQEVNKSG